MVGGESVTYKEAMLQLGYGTVIGKVVVSAWTMNGGISQIFDLVLGEDFYVPVENVSFSDTQLKF